MLNPEPITAGAPASPHAVDPHPKRSVAAWFAPDLALTGGAFVVVYLVMLFGGPSRLFRDSDAGWHIRAGEQMIATHTLPTVDTYSFTKAGQPWIAWEWGADVLAGAVHKAAGLAGVSYLYVTAICICAWMWFRFTWIVGGNFVLACLFSLPFFSTLSLHWLARPHIFGWLFTLGTVWFCEVQSPRARWAAYLGYAAVSAIWANIHGSFFLGPIFFVVYAAGAWLGKAVWGLESRVPARQYLGFALAGLLGSLANPYGWELHRHVVQYLFDSELLDRISEYQSFDFRAAGAGQITVALAIGCTGAFAALWDRRMDRFLLSALLLLQGVKSVRILPLVALILLPLANASITRALAEVRLAPWLRKRIDAIFAYGGRLRVMDSQLNGYALLPLWAVLLFFILKSANPGFPPDQLPVAAASRVAALPLNAKLFSSDKFGGYLIYRFAGERKVYFDGRSDFYGAPFLKTYARLMEARPGWRAEFAKQGFTYALLSPDSSIVAALKLAGWQETYKDKTAVLLKGPQS